MDSSQKPLRPTAELDKLIKSFRVASHTGDHATALRLIDRAWRIAPINPEINQLYGLLLLSAGEAQQAVELLDFAATHTPTPDIEAICISALLRDGQTAPAQRRLEAALSRFAVKPDGTLAQTARQVAEASGPGVLGWIGIAPNSMLHGEIIGADETVTVDVSSGTRLLGEYAIASAASGSVTPFGITLSGASADEPMTAATDKGRLLGANLSRPADFGFDGGIHAFRDGRLVSFKKSISGWASLAWDPDRPLDLTISNESEFSARLPTVADPLNPSRHRFTLTSELLQVAGNLFVVKAAMPDGTFRPLPGSPVLIMPSAIKIPKKSLRGGQPIKRAKGAHVRGIDIVIPVHSGLTETLDCIRSVRKTIDDTAKIVVIDDATPDAALASALDKLAAAKAITLLRNTRNLGFPGSVNRAMQLNTDRDIVVLNADTEVFGDWLTRLREAAYRAPMTGTATPLTNSGSIASYPGSGTTDPDSRAAREFDRLADLHNRGVTIDIPSGVGFCLFIRRDCLDETGYFDSEIFGKGYGEENDFCLRATACGWHHVLAPDVYVRHVGGRSFGSQKIALYERNLRLLFLRYPAYHALTDTFGKRDPVHPARRRLDEARLRATAGRSVLIVSLALDGGARRAVGERVLKIRAGGLTPITLKPVLDRTDRWMLTAEGSDLEDLYYEGNAELDAFCSLIGGLDLDHVELHHFLDIPPAIVDRLTELNCPIDIHIHDYIWYCPRITLLGSDGRYCGEPPTAACEVCIGRNGSRLPEAISVSALRQRSMRWLKAARRRVVPTSSVASRMRSQFPDLTFQVLPLETNTITAAAVAPIRERSIKVALIGALGEHKGYRRLLDMARHAAQCDLPLEFVVIGHTKDDQALFDTGRVFVTGEYQESEVAGLIAREAPDLALFLSEFPETWCYSLTHALHAGLPVAGLDLGAIGDRLRNLSPNPLLFPLSATPIQLCDRIIAAFDDALDHQDPPVLQNSQNETSSALGEHSIVATVPAHPSRGEILRKDMATQINALTATVDVLPLPRGLYLFSVKSTQSIAVVIDAQSGITLPAMQLSRPPGAVTGQMEFVSAPGTGDTWLSQPDDRIVVKVAVPTAILLTSILKSGMTPVEVEIQRLDSTAPDAGEEPVAKRRSLPPIPTTQKSIDLEVTAHIQNRGDMLFAQLEWALADADDLWIESFAISPLTELSPDMIEYRALTATGVETPWISNGASCGTRGIGVPLTGFAVQLKAETGAQGTCEYGAILLSSAVIGPTRDGAMCRSQDPQDPIVGLWISIDGQAGDDVQPTENSTAKPQEDFRVATAATEVPTPETEKRDKGPIGPRFSIFRDPGKTK